MSQVAVEHQQPRASGSPAAAAATKVEQDASRPPAPLLEAPLDESIKAQVRVRSARDA
jgi:hypothetical protein